jgi:hypothetical protein
LLRLSFGKTVLFSVKVLSLHWLLGKMVADKKSMSSHAPDSV